MELPIPKDFSDAVPSVNPHYIVDKAGNVFDKLGNEKVVNKNGKVKLMTGGIWVVTPIGWVILETFTGPNPYEVSGGAVVWKDGDVTNNNIDNLEWKSCPTLEKDDVFYRPDQVLIPEPSTEALQEEGFVEGRKMPLNHDE